MKLARQRSPGPISSTTSVDLTPALSTIDCTTSGFFRICWPLDLWNSMPAGGQRWRTRKHESQRGSGGAGGAGRRRRMRRCRWWAEQGRRRLALPEIAEQRSLFTAGGRAPCTSSPENPPAAFLADFLPTPPAARRPDMMLCASLSHTRPVVSVALSPNWARTLEHAAGLVCNTQSRAQRRAHMRQGAAGREIEA